MTNWQNMVRESIASLATGEGADYGYAYVERLNTSTYKIQTSRPLEEIEKKPPANHSLSLVSLPSLQAQISNTRPFEIPQPAHIKTF